ncbi:type IV pilin protein [Deefgea tanakiae]|uniref:Type IV pilin protein n=1 Tax=Deefgea tanakiae TaxID=2865840 RepID=A0ABX8Z4P4_9NEIS|nr:type IV pilin protein [Deefgea tanakiae]QZA77536.1 type IV pilin protein [Deefgea tanakiae]
MFKKTSGFTLIELMITVAVIGILASIAIPSYSTYIKKARRTDAQTVLLQNANVLERIYTTENKYGESGVCSTSIITETPIDGTTKYYDVSLNNCEPSTYTLTATPKGSQSSDGKLVLTHTGRKGWDKNNNGTVDFSDDSENKW